MLAEAKAYIIGVALLALVGCFLWYRHSLIANGERTLEAKVSEVTAAAELKRTNDLAEQRVKDMAAIDTVEKTYANALVSATQSIDDLNSRLRAYTSASRRGLALPGDPATPAGPDDASGVSDSSGDPVERAQEGVNSAASRDAVKIAGLQSYIEKVCH